MKTGREHRVPLSEAALAVLEEAQALADGSGLVFLSPSPRGRRLSDATITKMVRDLGIGAVPHGFRSSFRDWAAERTDAPREVCELALAPVNRNRVEAAYRRSDLFERQRALMEQRAAFPTQALAEIGYHSAACGPICRTDYGVAVLSRRSKPYAPPVPTSETPSAGRLGAPASGWHRAVARNPR